MGIPMKTASLHAKAEIEVFLRRNTYLHLYEIGDLDDFFWPYTIWYALKDRIQISQIVLLFIGASPPVLLGFTEESIDQMAGLLRSIIPLLPKQLHAHLSMNLASVFADYYQIQSNGTFYKMALTRPSGLDRVNTSAVVSISASDVDDLQELYRVSYPGNWFDPRMLDTGYYYGIRRGTDLVSVAGVHVYSEQYKIAALGNITTHPDYRKQGLATEVCAKLCQSLVESVEHIGLNVGSDNTSAIGCYEELGFDRVFLYGD